MSLLFLVVVAGAAVFGLAMLLSLLWTLALPVFFGDRLDARYSRKQDDGDAPADARLPADQ